MSSFDFYCACLQYNRENGQVARNTADIVKKLPKAEFKRLAELGRKK